MRLYLIGMISSVTPRLDLQDRLRLRERFFGATRTVLARL
ncbi:MAG: isopropylmalate isomerase [Sedimentitalea sp.]